MTTAPLTPAPCRPTLLRLLAALAVAATLWLIMFAPPTASLLPSFWVAMTVAAALLTLISITAPTGAREAMVWPRSLRSLSLELLLGVVIAAALWVVFYVGDKVSQLLFSFARPEVDSIYSMKVGTDGAVIAALLLCIIGPAEELFWRGYVQHTLSRYWHPNAAFAATTAVYTLVHLPSLNAMLILAACVCGIAWGGLYRLMPRHFLAIIVSHALWDAAAFVWWPL